MSCIHEKNKANWIDQIFCRNLLLTHIIYENNDKKTKAATWLKSNVRPGTYHQGTEREYRYSSALSLTSALDGVGG